MIPPKPWRILAPRPPWGSDRVYIVDADGEMVLPCVLDRDLAEHLVKEANEGTI